MFDNGNFRRKRKRRNDASGENAAAAVKSEEDAVLKISVSDTSSLLSSSSSPPSLQDSPSSQESKSSPSPSLDHSPCFNSFVSNMTSVLTGSGSNNHLSGAIRGSMRDFGSGHLGDMGSQTSGLGSYSPTLGSPVLNTDHTHGASNRMNYYAEMAQATASASSLQREPSGLLAGRDGGLYSIWSILAGRDGGLDSDSCRNRPACIARKPHGLVG